MLFNIDSGIGLSNINADYSTYTYIQILNVKDEIKRVRSFIFCCWLR